MTNAPATYRPHVGTRGPYAHLFSTDCSCGETFRGDDQNEADWKQSEHAAAVRSDALAAGVDSAIVDALDRAPRMLDRYRSLLDLGAEPWSEAQAASLIVDLLHFMDTLPGTSAAETLALVERHYDEDRYRASGGVITAPLLTAARAQRTL